MFAATVMRVRSYFLRTFFRIATNFVSFCCNLNLFLHYNLLNKYMRSASANVRVSVQGREIKKKRKTIEKAVAYASSES